MEAKETHICDCRTLPYAVQIVAGRYGVEIPLDALLAAMGLVWMPVAVSAEADPACWSSYGRDMFLVSAARLFGLQLRDVHPPDAARGLRGVPEFGQHFEASYRPLIVRALEHDQPVLAWGGWSDGGTPTWGLIEGESREGVGFAGRVFTAPRGETGDGDGANGTSRVLVAPATQLYVVEEGAAIRPAWERLWSEVVDHARQVLANRMSRKFAIVTGPAAFDMWSDRLAERGHRAGSVRLAACTVAAWQSGLRVLQGVSDAVETAGQDSSGIGIDPGMIARVESRVRGLIDVLSPMARVGVEADAMNERGIETWADRLRTAKEQMTGLQNDIGAD